MSLTSSWRAAAVVVGILVAVAVQAAHLLEHSLRHLALLLRSPLARVAREGQILRALLMRRAVITPYFRPLLQLAVAAGPTHIAAQVLLEALVVVAAAVRDREAPAYLDKVLQVAIRLVVQITVPPVAGARLRSALQHLEQGLVGRVVLD
jgi:hypothetical protein